MNKSVIRICRIALTPFGQLEFGWHFRFEPHHSDRACSILNLQGFIPAVCRVQPHPLHTGYCYSGAVHNLEETHLVICPQPRNPIFVNNHLRPNRRDLTQLSLCEHRNPHSCLYSDGRWTMTASTISGNIGERNRNSAVVPSAALIASAASAPSSVCSKLTCVGRLML